MGKTLSQCFLWLLETHLFVVLRNGIYERHPKSYSLRYMHHPVHASGQSYSAKPSWFSLGLVPGLTFDENCSQSRPNTQVLVVAVCFLNFFSRSGRERERIVFPQICHNTKKEINTMKSLLTSSTRFTMNRKINSYILKNLQRLR